MQYTAINVSKRLIYAIPKLKRWKRGIGLDMKKRIGTKLYDTDLSEFICESVYGRIYRKRTGLGEFFAHNETENAIIPLEYETAKEIVKNNAPKETYTTLFSISGKDDKKKMFAFSITETDKMRIRRQSAKRKMSMSEYIVWLVDQDEKRLLNKQDNTDRSQ